MRQATILLACLSCALIFTVPKANASLGQAAELPGKMIRALPQESQPFSWPRAKPATRKRDQEPSNRPPGPPIKRGKGIV
jgi:hypothetical protein